MAEFVSSENRRYQELLQAAMPQPGALKNVSNNLFPLLQGSLINHNGTGGFRLISPETAGSVGYGGSIPGGNQIFLSGSGAAGLNSIAGLTFNGSGGYGQGGGGSSLAGNPSLAYLAGRQAGLLSLAGGSSISLASANNLQAAYQQLAALQQHSDVLAALAAQNIVLLSQSTGNMSSSRPPSGEVSAKQERSTADGNSSSS